LWTLEGFFCVFSFHNAARSSRVSVSGHTSLFFDVFDKKRQAFVEICFEKQSDLRCSITARMAGKLGDWERHS
jgi:hypothetical protein